MSTPATLDDRRLLVPEQGPGHSYCLGGRPLVAVTTVIGTVLRAPELEAWFKRVGMQADAIRDEAAAFGKSIDAAMTAYVTGRELVPLDMPEAWMLSVEAGRRWIDENVGEVLAVQEPIASAKYGYAGMPDLYAVLRKHRRARDGRPIATIIDWKATGDVYWSHAFQTAAYRRGAVETYGDPAPDRMVLRFDKDEPGKVHPRPFKHHDRDFAGFGYCLGLYNVVKGQM